MSDDHKKVWGAGFHAGMAKAGAGMASASRAIEMVVTERLACAVCRGRDPFTHGMWVRWYAEPKEDARPVDLAVVCQKCHRRDPDNDGRGHMYDQHLGGWFGEHAPRALLDILLNYSWLPDDRWKLASIADAAALLPEPHKVRA